MKKFLLSLFVLFLGFLGGNQVFAEENPTKITFIYINGSNNLSYKHRLKFEAAFAEDVKKTHPHIKKRLENDELIKQNFLKNGQFVINEEPIVFYWGDRSLNVVESLDEDLKVASKFSPIIAHKVRSIFAHCLHDVVWVQKQQNMKPILDDLHQVVNEELNKGNKVVLFGYSAGSFVTYQYYLNKSNFIDSQQALNTLTDKELLDYIAKTPAQPTCFDALVDSNIIKYNPNIDKYEPNDNKEVFKKNYSELDKITQKECFCDGTVKGIVGFASPVRLFYSDLTDSTSSIHNISKMMVKSLIENDVFYLTVNYKNDPFGFATADNFTLKQIQDGYPHIYKSFKDVKGFVYNKSDVYVPRTFLASHLAYWKTPKRFAKAIVKAFNQGYAHFYNIEDKKNGS